jgi:hypothetical protein
MKGIAAVVIGLLLSQSQLYAGGLAYEHLRKEAFLRGGDAIRVALVAKSAPEVSERIPMPSPRPGPSPQAPGDKGLSKAAWIGLIAGFATAGALVYHYAVGPGASVRNCSTCND